MKRDTEFEDLLARARVAYDALTPEEKKAHDRAQRISWAYGQVKLAGSSLTYEQVEAIVDEYDRERATRGAVPGRLIEDDEEL